MLLVNIKRHLIQTEGRNTCIAWRYLGKYIKISTGTQDEKLAWKKGDEIFQKWLDGHRKFNPVRKLAFDVEVERYIENACKHFSPSTMICLRRDLSRLRDRLKLSTVIEFTAERFDKKWKDFRGDASPKYWVNILNNTRRFVGWAIKEKLIASDPTLNFVLPHRSEFKQKGTEQIWPDDEFREVCKKATKEDSDYLMLLRYTGLDVSDIFHLEKKDFVKTAHGLEIRKHRQKQKRNMAQVPLNSKVEPIAIRLLEGPNERVMPNVENADFRLFGSALYKRIMRLRENMKLPKRDLKSLRHTFATEHVEREISFDVIRKWLGHSKDSKELERTYEHRESTAKYMN